MKTNLLKEITLPKKRYTMRINNDLLKDKQPEAQYVSVYKGQNIVVQLFREPCYCVRILTSTSSQCYPLTFEQWNVYMNHARAYLTPDKQGIKQLLNDALIKEEQSNGYCARFWHNVAQVYEERLKEC